MNAEMVRPWWVPSSIRVPGPWLLLLAAPLLWADYTTGLYTSFPLLYVVPVCFVAWYSGRGPALALVLGVPVAHLLFAAADGQPVALPTLMAREILRAIVIGVLALWLSRLSDHERALQDELATLRGKLLPICSFCKSIKNNAGDWERLEQFISKRSQTQFSHAVCPTCREVYYFGMGSDE